jgi:hypothetical protein
LKRWKFLHLQLLFLVCSDTFASCVRIANGKIIAKHVEDPASACTIETNTFAESVKEPASASTIDKNLVARIVEELASASIIDRSIVARSVEEPASATTGE